MYFGSFIIYLEKTSRSAAGSSKASGRDDGNLSPSMNLYKASFYCICLYSLFSLFYLKKIILLLLEKGKRKRKCASEKKERLDGGNE